jgi:flagellar basal body-associated protein FliL
LKQKKENKKNKGEIFKMNKMTKKLLLSVLMVILTVGALGTTTFAWFTLTSTANVQPFVADVVSETGIEISLDNDTNDGIWVTQLTPTMIQAYIEEEIAEEFTFNQVTSPDGVDMNLLSGSEASDYLEIGIQIRSNDAETINLTEIGLSSEGVSWESDVEFLDAHGNTYDVNTTDTHYAANAARVSVRDNYAEAVQGIYELPAGAGTTPGDNVVLGELDDVAAPQGGQRDYYLQKTSVDLDENVTVPATSPSDNVDDLVATMLGEGDAGFKDFGQTYSGYITIRVWLEGWDPDMFNAILADTLTLSFQLED